MENIIEILQPWFKSILILFGFGVLSFMYRTVILKILYVINSKMPFEYGTDILDAFKKPVNLLLFIFGIYSALHASPLHEYAQHIFFDRVVRSCFAFSVFWGIYNLSDTTHGFAMHLLNHAGIAIDNALANIFSTTLRIIIVSLGFVVIAKEWNYDISGFLASLSIGSLAAAFAAKDTLANVFGSFVIIIEKPFQSGDWISTNGIEGTVEKISFRSTCVRTFTQELVYIPNSLLSNTPITNYTKRDKRKLEFTLGVTYNTTHDQMKKLVEDLRNYFINCEYVYGEDALVNFRDYADSSLNIFISCYLKAKDSKTYLMHREQINLDCMKILDSNGASCAFPSTSIYFETPLKQEVQK